MTKKEKRPTKTLRHTRKASERAAKSSGATSRPTFPVVGLALPPGAWRLARRCSRPCRSTPEWRSWWSRHLDPHHESILHNYSPGQRKNACHPGGRRMALEPNHVYVIPPNKDIAVRERTLRLLSAGGPPADTCLLIALCFSCGGPEERAIGVILSGTHPTGPWDCSHQVRRRHCLCQDPNRPAILACRERNSAGCVDFVLPPEEIARGADAGWSSYLTPRGPPPCWRWSRRWRARPIFQKILQILRRPRGSDFSLYKTGTIKRRVARRNDSPKIENLRRYGTYLEQPLEVAAPYQDIFIHVTSFFRNRRRSRHCNERCLPKPDGESAVR